MRRSITILALFLLMGSAAFAVPVYYTEVDAGDYIGSRSAGSGLTGSAPWSSEFQISWNIEDKGTYYSYSYTFNAIGGGDLSKALSHAIIEVSSNFTSEDIWNNNIAITDGDPTLYGTGPSNPGIPGDIFGIKFNMSEGGENFTFSFDSTRAPMWGNFYAKDGKYDGAFVYIFNNGFINLTSENIMDFIAVPDTTGNNEEPIIPEPATLALLGLGLSMAGLIRRRVVRRV